MSLAVFDITDQSIRPYKFEVGGQACYVTRFDGIEVLNEVGELVVEFWDFPSGKTPESMIGERAHLQIHLGENAEAIRHYHGIVRECEEYGVDEYHHHFRAVIVPEVWTLSLTSRSRVHVTDRAQNRNVESVLKGVLDEGPLKGSIEFKLTRSYEAYSFLTQYNQTDLDFVKMLCEEEGLTLAIDHREDREYVVISDDTTSFPAPPGFDTIASKDGSGFISDEHERLQEVVGRSRLNFGKVEYRGFDFKNSTRRLVDSTTGISPEKYAYYEYGGKFQDQEDARSRMKRIAENKVGGFNAATHGISGNGDYRALGAGKIFTIQYSSKEPLNRQWLSTWVRFWGTDDSAIGDDDMTLGTGGSTFEMEFQAIKSDTTYRPLIQTPKPTIRGCHTALVVGPAGEEIYTDKFGRIKIHMHLDRQPKEDGPQGGSAHNYDDESSFWCRCVQVAAGRKWGIYSIPRVGQEVLVDFIDGDVNHPMVVGCLFNDYNAWPYQLPDHKTRCGIKTNSTPGGDGFNEIRFEDKKGSEQIFTHAERNMDTRVKANSMETIGGSRHLTIGSEKYGGDQNERVYGNLNLETFKNKEEYIHEDSLLLVDGNQHTHVKKDTVCYMDGAYDWFVKNDDSSMVSGNVKQSIDKDRNTEITGNDLATVKGNWHVQANDIHFAANTGITLAVGGNFIKIDASGITIVGTTVRINSGGAKGMFQMCPSLSQLASLTDAAPTKPTPADNDKTGQNSLLPSPPQ